MVRSGDYYLFETDSEEDEEEDEDEKKKKKEKLPEKSAFQVSSHKDLKHNKEMRKFDQKRVKVMKSDEDAVCPSVSRSQFVYHAWITDSRTAMRARNNQEKLWKSRKEEKREGEEEEGGIGRKEEGEELRKKIH